MAPLTLQPPQKTPTKQGQSKSWYSKSTLSTPDVKRSKEIKHLIFKKDTNYYKF